MTTHWGEGGCGELSQTMHFDVHNDEFVQMDSKDADVAEWKKKCEEAVKKQETTHAEMGKLKNYIADLPTPDESTKRKEEISFCLKKKNAALLKEKQKREKKKQRMRNKN